MKSGDIVTLRHGRVVVQLLSDSLEHNTNIDETLVPLEAGEIAPFRRGDTGTVVEINEENSARVKIFYRSGLWWGNVSDMIVIA